MDCEDLLNSSDDTADSKENEQATVSGSDSGDDIVCLHVETDSSSPPPSSRPSNSVASPSSSPSTSSASSTSVTSSSSANPANDKMRQQISALRNDFANLVNMTQAKLDASSSFTESVETQLRKEIHSLREQLEDRELDYLILTAEKNTLLQTARCQPITPRSQARLRSMGKARLQAANEAWENFLKSLPKDEAEEQSNNITPLGRVQFNEKKNQLYEHSDEIHSPKVSETNENNNSSSNSAVIITSDEEAVAQQMRLRSSLKDQFMKKNSTDEHLLYKMHTVNFSPLLQMTAGGKSAKSSSSPSDEAKQLELRPLPELSEDCFERPIAAGLVTGFLSLKECAVLIDAAKHLGLKPVTTTFHPSYRNDKRVIFWDPNLATLLWARVRSLLPKRLSDRWSAEWTVLGFGSRISISEFGENTRYAPHQDSEYVENSATESLFSVIVCLQSCKQPQEGESGSAGSGGEINFVDPTQVHQVKLSVNMQAGELLLFPHYLWHETSRVNHGTLYEMRLEVLCREVGSEKDDGTTSEEEGDGSSEETESDCELPPLEDVSVEERSRLQQEDDDEAEKECEEEVRENGREEIGRAHV